MAAEDAVLSVACAVVLLSMVAWASLVSRSMARAWHQDAAALVAETLRMYLDAVAAGELDEVRVRVQGATIFIREGSLVVCSGRAVLVIEIPAGLEVRRAGGAIVIRRRGS